MQADAAASGSARVHIDALLDLGIAYNRNARRPEALAKYREAEAVYRASGLSDLSVLARIDRLIAVDLTNLDQPDAAIVHIARAHAAHLRLSAPTSQETADCLDVFLALLNILGRGIEGVAITQPSYDGLVTDASVPTHRRSQIMSSHSYALKLAGRLDEAETVVHESLRLEESLYGPAHMEITSTLSKLMSILRDQGRYDEASAAAERALAIKRASLTPNDPGVLFTLQNAARVALQAGKLERARSLIDEAVAGHHAQGSMSSRSAAWGRAVRIQVLAAQGELATAGEELLALEPLFDLLDAAELQNLEKVRKRL